MIALTTGGGSVVAGATMIWKFLTATLDRKDADLAKAQEGFRLTVLDMAKAHEATEKLTRDECREERERLLERINKVEERMAAMFGSGIYERPKDKP